MLIVEIALGILLAGFLYRYWRQIGLVVIAVVGLVVAVIYWQQVLGILIAIPLMFLLLSTVGPADAITNSRNRWRSFARSVRGSHLK